METFYLNKKNFCNPEYALEIVTRMGWQVKEQIIRGDPVFVVNVPTNEIHLMEFIFDYFL